MKVYIHSTGMIAVGEHDWEVVLAESIVFVHNINRPLSQIWTVQAYEKDDDWQEIGDY